MTLPELVEKIARVFSLSDLRGLCFQLEIDYDDLSGQNKKDKIIALVNYCKNRQRLDELVNQCQKLRPKETWHFNESWQKAKLIPPQQPKQQNLWVWITGAIVFALLLFGLVNFFPSILPFDDAAPTEIVEATLTPTYALTGTPTETVTIISTEEPTETSTLSMGERMMEWRSEVAPYISNIKPRYAISDWAWAPTGDFVLYPVLRSEEPQQFDTYILRFDESEGELFLENAYNVVFKLSGEGFYFQRNRDLMYYDFENNSVQIIYDDGSINIPFLSTDTNQIYFWNFADMRNESQAYLYAFNLSEDEPSKVEYPTEHSYFDQSVFPWSVCKRTIDPSGELDSECSFWRVVSVETGDMDNDESLPPLLDQAVKVMTLDFPTGEHARSIEYSPDGTLIASGMTNASVMLWDSDAGLEVKTLEGHTGWVEDLDWSPDGKQLVSYSKNEVIVWDIETGTLIEMISGHSVPQGGVSFSPNGKTVAFGSPEFSMTMWNLKSGELKKSPEYHTDWWVEDIAWSPDGDLLVSSSQRQTIFWDGQSGVFLQQINIRGPYLDWSPDGALLAIAGDDYSVIVWDLEDGEILHRLYGHPGVLFDVAFRGDGKTIASSSYVADGGNGKSVIFWDVSAGEEVLSILDSKSAIGLSISPDGTMLALAPYEQDGEIWQIANR